MDNNVIAPSYPAGKLNLNLRQIRLVTVLPGRYIDTVSCELQIASVDDLPAYYALSYAWGDRDDLRPILLNGVSYNVTRNLEAALRRLRHPTNPRLFWIDMLCIDQGCVEERTHQVNLMHLIYSKAEEGYVWLGDYEEMTVQDEQSNVHSAVEQQGLTQIEAVRAMSCIEQLSSGRHFASPEEADLPDRMLSEIAALDSMMRSQWWSRIWTVQEVVLPPKITYILGWLGMSWDTIVNASRTLESHTIRRCCTLRYEHWLMLKTFCTATRNIESVRAAYHKGEALDLLNLLHDFRDRLSTDPRDKVFGLLGLVIQNPKYETIRADYTLSARIAYQEFFIRLLQVSNNSLNLLARPVEFGRMLDLPTWIPDWTAKINELFMDADYLSRTSCGYLYKPSGSTTSEVHWCRQSTALNVKGLLIDEIKIIPKENDRKEATAPFFEDADTNGIDAEGLQYLEDIYASTKTHYKPFIGDGGFRQTFWRLHLMDQACVMNTTTQNWIPRRLTLEDYEKRGHKHGTNRESLYFYEFIPYLRVFITKSGYLGLGPETMKVGDTVHIFLGANVPFVLRRRFQRSNCACCHEFYEFVGNGYVHGMMDGEALDASRLRWFSLV